MPTRSIPWPRILAEGVAIVVSILLAFGIQAWWEGVQDTREARAVLADLGAELADSRDFIVSILDATAAQESAAHNMVGLFRHAGSTPTAVPDSLVALLFQDITLNQPLGAYESVVASGQIRLIEAQDLQNALASWASILDDVVEEQLRGCRWVTNNSAP